MLHRLATPSPIAETISGEKHGGLYVQMSDTNHGSAEHPPATKSLV